LARLSNKPRSTSRRSMRWRWAIAETYRVSGEGETVSGGGRGDPVGGFR
jgi:hypothetical protein